MIDEFSKYHPAVNILFYAFVSGITMFQMQMGLVIISLVCSALYYIYLKREKSVKFLCVVFVVMICSAVINPLFSHKGTTLLFYLFTGNPVTLESIIYGVFAAMIIGAVLLWLSTFQIIVCTDKMIAIVGNIFPAMATLLTMIIRLIPKISAHHKKVLNAQRGLKGAPDKWGKKLKFEADTFSITTTWALENSVDTADAMRARGYGLGKRTHYHNYKMHRRDMIALAWIFIAAVFVIANLVMGEAVTFYYPEVWVKGTLQVYIIYSLFCITPFLINFWEELKWHRFKSKI